MSKCQTNKQQHCICITKLKVYAAERLCSKRLTSSLTTQRKTPLNVSSRFIRKGLGILRNSGGIKCALKTLSTRQHRIRQNVIVFAKQTKRYSGRIIFHPKNSWNVLRKIPVQFLPDQQGADVIKPDRKWNSSEHTHQCCRKMPQLPTPRTVNYRNGCRLGRGMSWMDQTVE